jgi:methyl-accepting chemotaxis protein
MRRITVGTKIGAGFIALVIILLVTGATSYWIINSLSTSLANITGPVWDAMATTEAGIRAVQEELIAVDAILMGGEEENDAIQQADREAQEAFDRLIASGQVEQTVLDDLNARMQAFSGSRSGLTGLHRNYLRDERALTRNSTGFLDLLVDVERISSEEMLRQDMNAGSETETDSVEEQDRWATINAASEAKLALLTRLELYRRFKEETDVSDILSRIDLLYDDLSYAIETVGEDPLFEQAVNKDGFKAQSYKQVLVDLMQQHQQLLRAVMDDHRQVKLARQEYAQAAAGLMRIGEGLNQRIRQKVGAEKASLGGLVDTGYKVLLLAIVTGVLISLPVYWLTVRAIAGPIREIRGQLESISQGDGDLTVQLQIKSHDEIGDLAAAFNRFVIKLREMVAGLQVSAHRLVETAAEITRVAERTGHEVETQRQDVESVATAITQLSTSFREVTENTSRAAQRASEADRESDNGKRVVHDMVAKIRLVAQEVDRANAVIAGLGERSQAIESVLDVIRGISEQTNLLALNAAIEAARAGEKGRGFAVVADEVRSLAVRTYDSISEIQEMIDQLQQGTTDAIAVIQDAHHHANVSVEPARQAGDSLDQIAATMAAIALLNQEISSATDVQHETLLGVDQSVVNINQVAVQTSGSSLALRDSTHTLQSLASELEFHVGRFKV